MSGIRFHPPAVLLNAELRWVLLRAFGPTGMPAEVVDREAAETLARRLELAARIVVRTGVAAARGTAATSDAATSLRRDSVLAAVSQMMAAEAAAAVARAGADEGVSCCFLKGAALEVDGVLAAGSRGMCDVDVLVPADGARAIYHALEGRGFQSAEDDDSYRFHLPPLLHPELGMVEVHTELPGVVVPGRRRFATFEELHRTGLLVRCASLGAEAWVPSAPLMAAHLLAHALGQHGFRPGAYPQLRAISDLIDLGIAGEGGEALLATALPLVTRAVPSAEARALAAACRELVAGRVDLLCGSGPAATLLRHAVAGVLDDDYGHALKLQELSHPLGARSRTAARWAAAWHAVALTRGQIDRIYGRPRGRLGYAARRAWRPFDLIWRAWRSRWAGRARGATADAAAAKR